MFSSSSQKRTQAANPAKLILLSFAAAILAGTALLLLPISTVSGISPVNALFTSTSAVCVTGLIVVDTGSAFTRFGQTVIMMLIQLGGLGIMTFSTFFLVLFGKPVSATDRLSFRMMGERFAGVNLFRTLLFILSTALLVEGAGAGLLYLRFREMFPPGEAVYFSLFHSVSAFCNAGFSLFQDSLMGFQKEFFLPGVMMGLIVIGGAGFFVISDGVEKIRSWWGRKPFRMSLHSRVILKGSLILILSGAALIWVFERENQLAGLPLSSQIWNALFQSITPRTAGFNTLNTGFLSNPTLFLLIMLMFIGAAPASTAGGIKVSTFAVLLALIRSQIKGQEGAFVSKRKIPNQIVARALAVFAASFVLINLMTLLLLVTEHLGLPHSQIRGGFLELLFEVVSAFGTVGLSAGVTPVLTGAGKLLIIFVMYVGRIGPLTLALAVVTGRRPKAHYEYAEEEVMVG